MKKGILLARVSTPEQQKSGLSIQEIQIPKMEEYAAENDIEVIKQFVFQETASGEKLRKHFQEMIQYVIDNPNIKAILGYRVDRLTRNFRDAVAMDSLRTERDLELHFVSDRLVLSKNSRSKEITEWDTKVFLAKQHLNRCKEDGINNYINKVTRGHAYGVAPYGYQNVKGKDVVPHLKIIQNKYKSGVVTAIFDMYTSGTESYRSIAKKATEIFPTEKMSKGKVEQILTNTFYAGYRIYEGKEYPHIFDPLVSMDTFELAQKKRRARTKTEGVGKLLGKHGLYRGLITCADCGCCYTPSPNRHKKLGRSVASEHYYYCTNSKGQHVKRPPGTNDVELTKQFANVFKCLSISKEDLEWLVQALRGSHEDKKAFTEEEVTRCRSELDKLKERISNCYEDKLDGSITTEQYNEYIQKWNSQITKLQSKVTRLNGADEEYYITATMLLELASRSYELFMGSEPEQKRQIIALVLQNLSIKDGKLCYEWVKPFDSIFKTGKTNEWGG